MSKYNPKSKIINRKRNTKIVQKPKLSAADVILYGVKNERAAAIIEKDNTLSFICNPKANKPLIKEAFKIIYQADVKKINVVNTIKGQKKAYIRVKEEGMALMIADKAGII